MNKNLVWFTGAPGSKWSGTANVLQAIPHLNFNITDRSPEREYQHVGPNELSKGITHTGAYFGPGHGIGEDWDNFTNLNPMHIEQQIFKEWKDPSSNRLLVKSHFLSHHLDFLADTWKDNPIIMVIRPSNKCEAGWFSAGGWDISYPNYRPYYKDDDTMKRMIKEHNQLMTDFCNRRDVVVEKFNAEFLKEYFDWSINQLEDPHHRAWVEKHLMHTASLGDVSLAIYNIDALRN
jgi:hypothetical protein